MNYGCMAMTLKPKPNHSNESVQKSQDRKNTYRSVRYKGFADCFLRLQFLLKIYWEEANEKVVFHIFVLISDVLQYSQKNNRLPLSLSSASSHEFLHDVDSTRHTWKMSFFYNQILNSFKCSLVVERLIFLNTNPFSK